MPSLHCRTTVGTADVWLPNTDVGQLLQLARAYGTIK